MSINALPRKNKTPSAHIIPQIFAALAGGAIIFFLLSGAFTFAFNFYYSGRIYPGVSTAGNDLSGLTVDQAALLLSQQIAYPLNGRIVFQEGGSNWAVAPHELGFVFDAQSSARAAYETGRKGGPLARLLGQARAWRSGINLAPLMIYDERVAYGVDLFQVVESKLVGYADIP